MSILLLLFLMGPPCDGDDAASLSDTCEPEDPPAAKLLALPAIRGEC